MNMETAAMRAPDACPRCHDVFTRPTMPGHNRVPAHFLKAATWAYLCSACAGIMLDALGCASAGDAGIGLLREPLSCPECAKELDAAFKLDRETAGKKVPHPKAVSRIAWCDGCAGIVVAHLRAPVGDAAVEGSAT